jgi:feruloyl esterase
MKAQMAIAATLLASTAASALAAPSCTAEALNALHVANVTVTDATPVAATAGAPAYCDVKGTVVTQGEGTPNGSARFAMQLPDNWR